MPAGSLSSTRAQVPPLVLRTGFELSTPKLAEVVAGHLNKQIAGRLGLRDV